MGGASSKNNALAANRNATSNVKRSSTSDLPSSRQQSTSKLSRSASLSRVLGRRPTTYPAAATGAPSAASNPATTSQSAPSSNSHEPPPTTSSPSLPRAILMQPSSTVAASGPAGSPATAVASTPASPPSSPPLFGIRKGHHDGVDLDDIMERLLDSKRVKQMADAPNTGAGAHQTKAFCVKAGDVIAICNRVREIFLEQSVLLELMPAVNIVGDIHGQYSDLIRIFERCGYPPSSNFLFLGDYVDRGKHSLETILLLFCYKIKYPENFFILRGNHESASVNRVYGFFDECKRRSTLKVWKSFTDVFNCLPIAAVVAGKIFCLHGGLSPKLLSMDDIRAIQRPCDVPDFGLLNDLLWSDPSEFVEEWEDNERGVSYCFGRGIVTAFLARFDLDLVARAHMVVEGGYEFFADRQLVTIFSAPNYCGEFDNKGAVMIVNEDLLCSFEIIEPYYPKLGSVNRTGAPPVVKGGM